MLAFIGILAKAGGGSGGFGGGGGSRGGGGFGGGGGYYGGGGGGIGIFLVIAIVVACFLLIGAVGTFRYRRKRHARAARVQLAAAEAAEDDALFASDEVLQDAAALFGTMQEAWDDRDRARLASLAGEDLMVEWARRLDDFDAKGWHNRVRVLAGPAVEYVGLVNRAEDSDDRVVVRLEAQLEDYVQTAGGGVVLRDGQTDRSSSLCEYWTLGKRDGDWILLSIEQRAEGDHQLDAEIVATPWGDTERLRDEALVEGAVADRASAGFATHEIADLGFEGDARSAALDLALADGRFAPDVLEAATRRAVAAWAEAIDGADDALLAVATTGAVRALLYPGDATDPPKTRLVVRGGRIERVQIEALDAAAEPARMTLAVTVRGRRYVEDRDTADVLSGNPSRDARFTERWVLALDGPDAAPWRIVAADG